MDLQHWELDLPLLFRVANLTIWINYCISSSKYLLSWSCSLTFWRCALLFSVHQESPSTEWSRNASCSWAIIPPSYAWEPLTSLNFEEQSWSPLEPCLHYYFWTTEWSGASDPSQGTHLFSGRSQQGTRPCSSSTSPIAITIHWWDS